MKTILTGFLALFSGAVSAQYYYKDIVGTRESAELMAAYRQAKVRSVRLNSYTVNNQPLSGFVVQQEYMPAQNALRTVTKTEYTPPSYLTTYADASGRIARTTDSTNGIVNTSVYTYNGSGDLTAIFFTAGDNLTTTRTDHRMWEYDNQGRISRMVRIKNDRDTSYVTLKYENGMVAEEQERRRVASEEPFYYYYDDQKRLTDVVRFGKKAGRLMPEYMFEYSDKNQVIQRITVPQNSTDYLIWRYAYNDKGLKTKEVIYNKDKEQTGKVEYEYTFGN